jgi:hypothetical protein
VTECRGDHLIDQRDLVCALFGIEFQLDQGHLADLGLVIDFEVVFGDVQQPLESLPKQGQATREWNEVETDLDSLFVRFLSFIFLDLLLPQVRRRDILPFSLRPVS